jgi:hypothetical protein
VHADPILPFESFIFYACNVLCTYVLKLYENVAALRITLLYYPCYPFVVYVIVSGSMLTFS